MKITWLGHSCFKIEKDDFSIIIDPYCDGSIPGLKNLRETANKMICSHEHEDHNGRACVKLIQKRSDPFRIITLHTFHDDTKGSQRGKNVITIFDDGIARVAHFGDLGCDLTEEEKKELTGLDAALIPVGGFFTIDATMAAHIIREICPKKVIPMHYRDAEKKYGYDVIDTVDSFITVMGAATVLNRSSICTEEEFKDQVIILTPENKEP